MKVKSYFGKPFIYFAAVAIVFSIVSCNNGEKKKNADSTKVKKDTVKKVSAIKGDKQYNDIAKFIAGIAVDQKSDLYEMTQNPQFKNYQAKTDTNWSRYFKRNFNKVSKWITTETADLNKSTKTLYYPFSGADFLHMVNFWPYADKYIMIGLEPVGTIPNPKKQNKDTISKYFSLLNKAIDDVVNLSFFKTVDMKVELNNERIDGTLPIMMLFMARTKANIVDLKPVEVNEKGEIAYLKEFKDYSPKEQYNKGVEVSFTLKDSTHLQKVYYFSCDLSDGGLAKNAAFTAYLNKLDNNVTTYIKSASYLMHNKYFSVVRDNILNKSKAILQDDSGIPYKFFDDKVWDVTLYGTYIAPIDMFKNRLQENLRDAYTKKSKALEFKTGYGKRSDMQLAIKKEKK